MNRSNNIGKNVAACMLLLFTLQFSTAAQTLFSYGKHEVSSEEFLLAYQKNHGSNSTPQPSIDEYLQLYLQFRLKVQDALDARMDTSAVQRNELRSFRDQLADAYMKEDAGLSLLVEEARQRSLKDIHISRIFIPVPADATPAEKKVIESEVQRIYGGLQNGDSPERAAAGHTIEKIGYITVFVLPYAFENAAYQTPAGKYSIPLRTADGFFILRNDHERKAAGTIRVAQILLAYPPGADQNIKSLIAQRADSIYAALKEGADFAKLARTLSDDNHSYQNGGELPPFGVGQYDSEFESQAFSLTADGEISTPFETSFGYHILYRLQQIPVIDDVQNRDWQLMLQEKVLQSDRMNVSEEKLVARIRELVRDMQPAVEPADDTALLLWYRRNLEKYNPAFAEQLEEFRKGNLLFAIMQKKVWDVAATDSLALREYFLQNQKKYRWERSADALIVTCTGPSASTQVQQSLKNNPVAWHRLTAMFAGVIQADSGRFELAHIPVVDRTDLQAGQMTAPVSSTHDSTATFAYIIRMYPENEQKSFNDARGSVISDYQEKLEKDWMIELRKRYPVRINKKVLKKLKADFS